MQPRAAAGAWPSTTDRHAARIRRSRRRGQPRVAAGLPAARYGGRLGRPGPPVPRRARPVVGSRPGLGAAPVRADSGPTRQRAGRRRCVGRGGRSGRRSVRRRLPRRPDHPRSRRLAGTCPHRSRPDRRCRPCPDRPCRPVGPQRRHATGQAVAAAAAPPADAGRLRPAGDRRGPARPRPDGDGDRHAAPSATDIRAAADALADRVDELLATLRGHVRTGPRVDPRRVPPDR